MEDVRTDQALAEALAPINGIITGTGTFKRYIAERHPENAIRLSKRGYRKNGEITNIPLYLAGRIRELL